MMEGDPLNEVCFAMILFLVKSSYLKFHFKYGYEYLMKMEK